MNDLGRFIQEQMDARDGMTQAELSRRSGLSESHIHKLLTKDQGLPTPATINALARAFPPMSATDVLLHAARACGYSVEPTEPPPPAVLSDTDLLRELSRRLAVARPLLPPMDLNTLPDRGLAAAAALSRQLEVGARKSAAERKPGVAELQLHLAEYVRQLATSARAAIEPTIQSDHVQPSSSTERA